VARARRNTVAALRTAGCVFAEEEAGLLLCAARDAAELAVMLERRCTGLPLEHVLGWADFCGLRVSVAPGVFVPRRRTGFLVRQAAALVAPASLGPTVVVDLCCGSGAVGAAIAAAVAGVELHAVDIDPVAVRCAHENLRASGGHAYEGDLYQPLPARLRGRVDLLVANAPYVPSEAIALMPEEARLHEPRVALDGGPDGLDVQRRVIASATSWLAPPGHLLMETTDLQAAGTVAACRHSGLAVRLLRSEELGATVVVARRG
jgi:release factor glutamine methyltransferase